MRIIYINKFSHTRIGHLYKYFSVLQGLYGGEQADEGLRWEKARKRFAGTKMEGHQFFRAMVESILHDRPDMAVVSGDGWPISRYCLAAGIPYVLLEEDIFTWRAGGDSASEKQMLEGARAIIFTSEDHQGYCQERYELPPNIVVHLRPLREDLAFDPLPKLPGKTLVYAGGLVPKWEDRKNLFGYRAYHSIFWAAVCAGWQVHVYNPYIVRKGEKDYREYKDIGVIPHDAVSNKDLYRELSQYTAGLHGYNLTDVPPAAANYVLGCRPNKCWEYLGAGIPTIGVNVGNSGKIFNGKWGTVLRWRSFRDLVAEFRKMARKLPIITDTMRFTQTIEQDYSTFRELLDPILTGCPSKRSVG